MAGKSAKANNRGLSLLSNFISGKARDFRTSTNAYRYKPGVLATGGDVSNALVPGNGYVYHSFVEPGTFEVTNSGTAELLLIGGGGAGGYKISGGGGAGGVLYGSITLSLGVYNISVGKGGASNSGAIIGGSPTDFYENGTSFPNPGVFARAYGGGGGGGYGSGITPSPGSGAAGGSSGGSGSNYGTTAANRTSDKEYTAAAAPVDYIRSLGMVSPITNAPGATNYYGSDIPAPATYYDQSLFPSTYYMGLQGYGNNGGRTYGSQLDGGGAGGGGAGGVGENVGTAPNTNSPTTAAGADGGYGRTFSGFTAPVFCDPTQPNGASVKTALDPLGGYFAGGGGGSNYNTTQGGAYGGGKGGKGGGGNGSPDGNAGPFPAGPAKNNGVYRRDPESSTNMDAVLYSGAGGGGAGYSLGAPSGYGGPGIVIIRYLAAL